MTDPIADLISRIKNAYMGKLTQLEVPSSKVKYAITQVLIKEGFLKSAKITDKDDRPYLILELIYTDKEPALTDIKQISKSGVRIYSKVTKIPRVLGGLGFSIISTPKGIMSSKEAKKQRLGGEIICQVW